VDGGTSLDTDAVLSEVEGLTLIYTDLYFYISVFSVTSVANTNSYTIKFLERINHLKPVPIASVLYFGNLHFEF